MPACPIPSNRTRPVDPLLPAVNSKSAIPVDTAAALDAVMVRAGSEGLTEGKAVLFRKEAVKEAVKLRKVRLLDLHV